MCIMQFAVEKHKAQDRLLIVCSPLIDAVLQTVPPMPIHFRCHRQIDEYLRRRCFVEVIRLTEAPSRRICANDRAVGHDSLGWLTSPSVSRNQIKSDIKLHWVATKRRRAVLGGGTRIARGTSEAPEMAMGDAHKSIVVHDAPDHCLAQILDRPRRKAN